MAGWRSVAVTALCGVLLLVTACEGSDPPRLFTVAATNACLKELPEAIAGLPPATPPTTPALFVYALPPERFPLRARGELGAWRGHKGAYEGMTLSFFKTARDARAARKPLVWLYGGKRIRNVVVAWDQSSGPTMRFRKTVLGCLRAEPDGRTPEPKRSTPRASLATFSGYWGGHTRGLRITSGGRGFERANSGCCVQLYDTRFQIRSVSGTLTRAEAVYRVKSFKRYERDIPMLTKGQVGKLVLRNGIVRNTLTKDYFCSNPAWGATGACGA